MNPSQTSGMVTIASCHSVDATVARLTALLAAKGVKLFAVIDHSGEAAAAGLVMPPTKVVIFGSPQAGTPLMLVAPSIALDLPLKLLIAEDASRPEGDGSGRVTLSYNSPAWLRDRHHLPETLMANIAVIEALAKQAAE
ncbi:MAG TPA: DUF302 domain-containing protein [Granulicella sp.]|jgi:uncharacterized protein (DUF302 family)|nr:DUF302 domain-containing protein [Granulicella sp.]